MIVFGTCGHPAAEDARRRMEAAAAANAALPGVIALNLQWADAATPLPGLRTLPVLRQEARALTGRDGPRKPVVAELLDALAAAAERRGITRMVLANADVRLTPRLVRWVAAEMRDGAAVSRLDLGGGEPPRVQTAGLDAFALETRWWRRHRRRLRPYLLGEPVWDNVLAAILLGHGDGCILNDGEWLLHERHPAAWRRSPYAEYTRWLAALDRPYFTRWAHYHAGLERLRAAGASPAAEAALQPAAFRPGTTAAAAAVQAARVVRAGLRYVVRG